NNFPGRDIGEVCGGCCQMELATLVFARMMSRVLVAVAIGVLAGVVASTVPVTATSGSLNRVEKNQLLPTITTPKAAVVPKTRAELAARFFRVRRIFSGSCGLPTSGLQRFISSIRRPCLTSQ